jgi:hypothetical protein
MLISSFPSGLIFVFKSEGRGGVWFLLPLLLPMQPNSYVTENTLIKEQVLFVVKRLNKISLPPLDDFGEQLVHWAVRPLMSSAGSICNGESGL